MTNYFGSSFNINQSHIEGCQIDISSNLKSVFSIGNDDVICEYSINQQPMISSITNKTDLIINRLAVHPTETKSIVIGTANGFVFLLSYEKSSYQLKSSILLYKTSNTTQKSKINCLQLTQNGNYLLIGTNQPYCIVYDWLNKKFAKLKLSSESQIISYTVDSKNAFFSAIDSQGKTTLYKIQTQQVQEMQVQQDSDSQDPFTNTINKQNTIKIVQCDTYRICPSSLIQKYTKLTSCFSSNDQFLSETLYLPGQNTLQRVQLNIPPAAFSGRYSLISKIYHTSQIIHVLCLKHQKASILLTSTQLQITLWQQKSTQKLMIFDNKSIFDQNRIPYKFSLIRQSTTTSGFTAIAKFTIIAKSLQEISAHCKVYQFTNFKQLSIQLQKLSNKQQSVEHLQIIQIEGQKFQVNVPKKIKKKATNKVQAYKLLPSHLQLSLYLGYQQHNSSKFLFYNQVGCIIQRIDSSSLQSSIQIELHDRSKLSRIKIPAQSKFEYFALCSDTFFYGSVGIISLQCEKFLKEGYTWQYAWEDVEGLAIGVDYLVAINKSQIKFFDWVGVQLHTLAFDRRYVAMAAFQDHLAIVYHSALPLYGVQSFKMLLFEVTTKQIKLIKDVMVPVKPNSSLKWFGFSEQGMIFCQDDAQNLRFYNYELDEWILTLSLDSMSERLFIQHIQNYQIYGFRLAQKFPNQPRVMPRSLPRKIPFDISNFKVQYLSSQQNQYIKKHKLSIMWLQHDKYRSQHWYKYKYSRAKDNRWYNRSYTVKSQEEIRVGQAQLDLKLLDYLRKYVKMNKNQQDKTIWNKLLSLCNSLSFYQQTRNKLQQLISQSDIMHRPKRQSLSCTNVMQNPETTIYQFERQSTKGLSQLSHLQQMMGLSWANFPQVKSIKMQVQEYQ